MKAKFSLAIIATTALLTACGGGHDKVHAVDKLEEAQKIALEKAPKAEEVKFADHGETPMGGVGGAGGVKVAEAPAEAPKADATATATATADTKAEPTKEAEKPADKPAEDAKPAEAVAEEAKAEEAKSEEPAKAQ